MFMAAGPSKSGGALLILGLTHENITRLKAKRPLGIESERLTELVGDHGHVSGVVIFYARDEETALAYFQKGGLVSDATRSIDELGPDPDVLEAVAKELQSENRARGLGLPGEPSLAEVRRIVTIYLEKARGV